MLYRKSSDRISAKEDQQGRMKAMFMSDVFSPHDAKIAATKMIEKESRGYGDQMNAYERVAEKCGMSARQLRRFLSNEVKNPGYRVLNGIKIGWISLWRARALALLEELDDKKEKYGSEHFVDIEAEALALAHRLEIALEKAMANEKPKGR